MAGGRHIYKDGRWMTVEAAYAREFGTLKYLKPRPEPDSGTAVRLFEPDTDRKPTAAELYELNRRG